MIFVTGQLVKSCILVLSLDFLNIKGALWSCPVRKQKLCLHLVTTETIHTLRPEVHSAGLSTWKYAIGFYCMYP